MNLPELFGLSLKHSLTVAAAMALERSIILPEYFKEEKFKIIRRLSLFEIERKHILSRFEQKKIWYLPMKGTVTAEFYPKTAMREMSDNDILFDESRKYDVREIMTGLGYSCCYFDELHHDVYKKGGMLTFEMHRSLTEKDIHTEIHDYFRNIFSRLKKDEVSKCAYHMTNEDFYIFMICHLYKHYTNSGTGLRALLDVYVFNRANKDQLDFLYIKSELDKLRLSEFEAAVNSLSLKVFTGERLSKNEQDELDFFIGSNTHGTKKNLMAKNLGNNASVSSKGKYVLRRVFPSEKDLKNNHPIVYRCKALYPLLVLYRPIKGVIKHRKLMFGEIKRLKNFKSIEAPGKFN